MAGIIQIAGSTGYSWYCIIRDKTGKVWNGSAFETYNSGNWTAYKIEMPEQTGSGYYTATFPAGISTPGVYFVAIHQADYGLPQLNDPVVGQTEIAWDGSAVEQGLKDMLFIKTLTELSSGVPPVTPTLAQALMLIYMALRNKRTATDSTEKIYKSDGTPISSATVSDDGVTFTKEAFGNP